MLLSMLLSSMPSLAASADPTLSNEYQAEYHFGPEISASKACALAGQRLKLAAVAKACGTRNSAVVNRLVSGGHDDLAVFHLETTMGGVVSWREVGREILSDIDDRHRCVLRAEVGVACHPGVRDPGFNPDFAQQVHLDDSVYHDGDRITLQVEARQPLYLYVYQHIPSAPPGKRLQKVFPNPHQSDALVDADSTVTIPDGYLIEARLPSQQAVRQGARNQFEQLLLLATRHPVTLADQLDPLGWARTLAEIPLQDRREALIGYRIVPRGGPSARSADTVVSADLLP